MGKVTVAKTPSEDLTKVIKSEDALTQHQTNILSSSPLLGGLRNASPLLGLGVALNDLQDDANADEVCINICVDWLCLHNPVSSHLAIYSLIRIS